MAPRGAAMKLYDAKASPNCRKVRVLARELGIVLEIVPVDLFVARDPAYAEQNPTGKVPTLVDDDGRVIWESGAILVHLAERFPAAGVWPADATARATVLRWMFFAATHLQPWLSVLGQERILKPRRGEAPDPALVGHAERELARFLPIVDEALARDTYLAGGFSIADVAVGAGLEGAEGRGVDLGRYLRLAAWRDGLRSRPSWADPD